MGTRCGFTGTSRINLHAVNVLIPNTIRKDEYLENNMNMVMKILPHEMAFVNKAKSTVDKITNLYLAHRKQVNAPRCPNWPRCEEGRITRASSDLCIGLVPLPKDQHTICPVCHGTGKKPQGRRLIQRRRLIPSR